MRNHTLLAALLATVLTAGCGGGTECKPACEPACAAGTICSADLHGHLGAVWQGVCLTLCSRPGDCGGELRCRSFGGNAPFVCASDALPVVCDPRAPVMDDQVGDAAGCRDADTLAQPFSATNETRGHELVACANGCEELGVGTAMGARCR